MIPYPSLLAASLPVATLASHQIGQIAKSGIEAFQLGIGYRDFAGQDKTPIASTTKASNAPLTSLEAESQSDLTNRLKSLLKRLQEVLGRAGADADAKATLQSKGDGKVVVVDGGGYGNELESFLNSNPDFQIELDRIVSQWRSNAQLPISTGTRNVTDDLRRSKLVMNISPSQADWNWKAI